MWRSPLALLALSSTSALAQQAIRLEGPPQCATCSISVTKVVTLGATNTPFSLHRLSKVAVDSKGNYIVAPTYNAGEIALFDRAGRYQRSFGRAGQGPGEFGTHIGALRVGAGDTVHVFHENRHTVLRPGLSGLVLSRQIASEARYPVGLSNGRWAFHAVAGGGSAPRLLHVLEKDGSIVRSFEDQRPRRGSDPFYANTRIVGAAGGDRIWSARFNEYRLERWTLEGTQDLVVDRRVPWFTAWPNPEPGEPLQSAPKPRITDVREDRSGILWVLTLVASADWKAQPSSNGLVAGTDPKGLYDTVIEAIDIRAQRVIAEVRLPDAAYGFIDDQPTVYSRRMASDGQYLIDIWRLSLNDTSTRRNPYRDH